MRILNAERLKCPLPLLRTQKMLREMSAGEVLLVRTTDFGSREDLEVFCEQEGHQFLSYEREAGVDHIRIQKRA